MDPIRAAGGVVHRGERDAFRVAVVHRPRYDDWTLPKGKLETGETDEDGALREVEEETGLRCALEDQAGSTRYRDRHGRPKVVIYFFMTPIDGTFRPNNEVDELRWLPPTDAMALLTHQHDRDLVAKAARRAGL